MTGFIQLPQLQVIFDQVNLQTVLIYILIRCYCPDFHKNPQNTALPDPSERIIDLIAASALNLIDYMIFRRVDDELEIPESMTQSFFGLRRTKQPSVHENRLSRIKSYSLVEPVAMRQSSATSYSSKVADPSPDNGNFFL